MQAPYIQSEEFSDRVPAVDLLQKAEVDPEAFIAHEFAWYDGSIRAMDVEIGRLLEGLEAHGLGDKTLGMRHFTRMRTDGRARRAASNRGSKCSTKEGRCPPTPTRA